MGRKKLNKVNLCPVCNGEGTKRGKVCKACKGTKIYIPKPPDVTKKK